MTIFKSYSKFNNLFKNINICIKMHTCLNRYSVNDRYYIIAY